MLSGMFGRASAPAAAAPTEADCTSLATAATLPLASPASTATAAPTAARAAAPAFAPREAALIARLTRLGALGGEQSDGSPPLTNP